jgi:hypothetical protein
MGVVRLLSLEDHKRFINRKGYVVVVHIHEDDWPSTQFVARCAAWSLEFPFVHFGSIDVSLGCRNGGGSAIACVPTAAFFRNGVPLDLQVAGTDYMRMETILRDMRADGAAIAEAVSQRVGLVIAQRVNVAQTARAASRAAPVTQAPSSGPRPASRIRIL